VLEEVTRRKGDSSSGEEEGRFLQFSMLAPDISPIIYFTELGGFLRYLLRGRGSSHHVETEAA
jgi:hypothetical protein